jgi:6,7-dimethyl-8-ribityllumazine synthase
MQKIVQGLHNAKGLKIGIVVSRWNRDITESLRRGAERALIACGADMGDITVVEVPGAFEIPLACSLLASQKTVDAIVALGCIIKGDTAHFEHVAHSAMEGIREVSLKYDLPVTCGILTTYTEEQALARAGDDEENKGSEAALTAIEMASLRKSFLKH